MELESPVVPVWISFPNLRAHLFASRILNGLGRIFGNPLKIDNATSTGSRPSVARVLVEIDVSKKFPEKIWIGPENAGYVQSVVFEKMPEYCVHCSSLGHSKNGCNILHPHLTALGEGGRAIVRNVVASGNEADVVGGPSVPLVLTENNVSSPIGPLSNNVISGENDEGCENIVIANETDVVHSVEELSVYPAVNGVSDILNGVNPDVVVKVGAVPVASDIFVSSQMSLEPVSAEGGRGAGGLDIAVSPVDVVNDGPVGVSPKLCEPVVNSDVNGMLVVSQNLVEVPVQVVDPHLIQVGGSVDVRTHGDWLNNSSDSGSDSESLSDPSYELKLDRDRPLFGTSRGKFWGRGGRRR